MDLNRRQGWIGLGAVLAFVTAILLFRIWGFGIWDPWELNPADEARELVRGHAPAELRHAPLGAWLVAAGFRVGGVHEWAGRLPIALCAVLIVLVAFLLLERFAGRRAGLYGAIVVSTSPLFVLNARQMVGESPSMLGQALVALGFGCAVFVPKRTDPSARQLQDTAVWLAVGVFGAVVATLGRGALLGVMPPLVAVGGAVLLDGVLVRGGDRRSLVAAWVVVGAAVLVAAVVGVAVFADRAGFSMWTGGVPRAAAPPGFDAGIEDVFHSFAPWSALLPLAFGQLLRTRPAASDEADLHERRRETALRLLLVLWATLGYAAQTVFASRFGPAPFLPLVAVAGAVAVFLSDVKRSENSWWTAGVIGALLTGLVLRDYKLYTSSPVDALPLEALTVPTVFDPTKYWAVVLGLFAVTAFLGLGIAPSPQAKLDIFLFYRFLRDQWRKPVAFKLWLVFIALLLVLLTVAGVVLALFGESWEITPQVVKWGGRATLLVPVVLVLIHVTQLVVWIYQRLGAFRLVPLLGAGLLTGAYVAQGFLPELSNHFSPREVYDAYNTHAGSHETLVEYRVGGRAAAYYAQGTIRDVDTVPDLLAALREPSRVWAAFPTEELPEINRQYRRASGHHLFVADGRSARVVLAVNQPVQGLEDENYIAEALLDRVPEPQHPVHALFEDKVELVGYDLALPHDGYVGAGESFKVTWYWRVMNALPGGFKIFLHVDGQGNRLNGDHEPVHERYPVRLWDPGDIIRDEQELTVPANYRPGPYTFFIGFYSGETRLQVVQGPEDEANRVVAGELRVR